MSTQNVPQPYPPQQQFQAPQQYYPPQQPYLNQQPQAYPQQQYPQQQYPPQQLQVMPAAPVVPEEERFQNNLGVLCDIAHTNLKVLCEKGYVDNMTCELCNLAASMVKQFDRKILINSFINNSHLHCWDRVHMEDVDFFIKDATNIFKALPVDKVLFFKELFEGKDRDGKPFLTDVIKADIWRVCKGLVKISIKYVHRERMPYSKLDPADGKQKLYYGASFMPNVDLDRHGKKWGIEHELLFRVMENDVNSVSPTPKVIYNS